MKAGEKLLENGVEVALYPDPVLCYDQHLDYCYIDFNGRAGNAYAPCKVKVVKNDDPNYHIVWFWTVEPVKTLKGITHLTFLFEHDNDVSDLKVGDIIEQGGRLYQEGGFGPKGPTTYPAHYHMGVAIGHTTKRVTNKNGKPDMVGCVYANEVLYLAGNEDIQKLGNLKWEVYKPPVYAIMANVYEMAFKCKDDMKIRVKPSTDYAQNGLLPRLTQVDITQSSIGKVNGYEWVKLTYKDVTGYCAVLDSTNVFSKPTVVVPIVKPVEVIIKPVIELVIKPIVELPIVEPIKIEPVEPTTEETLVVEPIIEPVIEEPLQPIEEPIIEVVEPVIDPIVEPIETKPIEEETPTDEQVIEELPNVAPMPQKQPQWSLWSIIKQILDLIINLFRREL